MTSLLIYDEHCGWSPSLNASKGTGGSEIHLVQIASWLAAWRGWDVEAWCHDGSANEPLPTVEVFRDGSQHFYREESGWRAERGVRYHESRGWEYVPPTDVLLTVRRSRIPKLAEPTRILTLVTDDPRNEGHLYEHLLGRTTLVCVSEWQAGLYRELGHTCVVIPAMIDDATYDLVRAAKNPRRYVCVSAWNKGTDATLEAWGKIRHTLPEQRNLYVGSPYSAPDDAEERCAAVGAYWLGILKPAEIVTAMAHSAAHVRVCTIGETFGATDAIARAVGCRVHVHAPGDVGALDETIPGGVWRNRDAWVSAVRSERDPVGAPAFARDYRVSTVMPQWAALLGLPCVTPTQSVTRPK